MLAGGAARTLKAEHAKEEAEDSCDQAPKEGQDSLQDLELDLDECVVVHVGSGAVCGHGRSKEAADKHGSAAKEDKKAGIDGGLARCSDARGIEFIGSRNRIGVPGALNGIGYAFAGGKIVVYVVIEVGSHFNLLSWRGPKRPIS